MLLHCAFGFAGHRYLLSFMCMLFVSVCLPSFGVETLLLITVKAYVDSLKPILVLHSGFYHALSGGKQKTPTEYFMANHKLRTIPVALSILVSFVSGVVVLGTPAEMYTRCCNDCAFFLTKFCQVFRCNLWTYM